MEARWRGRIIGMADKVSGEDRNIRACWCRYRTSMMDKTKEEMWDGNR